MLLFEATLDATRKSRLYCYFLPGSWGLVVWSTILCCCLVKGMEMQKLKSISCKWQGLGIGWMRTEALIDREHISREIALIKNHMFNSVNTIPSLSMLLAYFWVGPVLFFCRVSFLCLS